MCYAGTLFVLLSCLAQGGDLDSNIKLANTAAVDFSARHAKADRYLVVGVGKTYSSERAEYVVGDFEYVYAIDDRGSPSEQLERVEINHLVSNSVVEHRREIRQLKVPGHLWVKEAGPVSDVLALPPDAPRSTPPIIFDPFTLPISFWSTLRISFADYRNLEAYVMPPGRLFSAEIDEKHVIGRWRLGRPDEFGYSEIYFSREFQNMPVTLKVFMYKHGVTTVDATNFRNQAVLSCETTTQWIRSEGGQILPEIVESVDYSDPKNPHNWEFELHWWTGDEVPNEIFTTSDFSKSHVKESVVNKLFQKRTADKKSQTRPLGNR